MSDQIVPRAMTTFKDLTGQRFGRLTVVSYNGMSETKRRRHVWECACDCGGVHIASTQLLRSGDCLSCGCLKREHSHNASHGMSGTPTYKSWNSMLQRCNNPNLKEFRKYGAVGISVCDRWKKFSEFLADMGERPAGTSIDRIDGKNGYYPENCRWATPTEQAQNQKKNVFFTYKGQTYCLSEWARRLGIHRATIDNRLKRGMSFEDAIS